MGSEQDKWEIAYVGEQLAIFDKRPDFMLLGLIVQTVNYNAFGGASQADLREAREDGYENPRVFNVRVTVEYKDVTETRR